MSTAPEGPQQPEQRPDPSVEPAAHLPYEAPAASQRHVPDIDPADAPPAEPVVTASRNQVQVRRAPKYSVFIFGGIIVGIIATFVALQLEPGDSGESFLQAFGYFVLYGITFGALLGAIVAVILDAVASRRARSIDSERTTVEVPGEPDDGVVEGELEE
ncbi:hypothetical protein [Frondihabitans cladoniiphilus]|uniref:Uncharacterized protein n=1 Tax=Frondihabitans cladoniiphilus TaxID=715785 RepID=A0ABP8W2U3_9MICO